MLSQPVPSGSILFHALCGMGSGMPKIKVNGLSAVKVRQIKKPGRYCDGNGLYLVVDGPTAKRYVLRVVAQGRRRDIGLGSVMWLSLADAREKARELRKVAREGGDPVAYRKRNEVPTFEVLAREMWAEHKEGWRNPKHAAQWISSLEIYAFPSIGDQLVSTVSSKDIHKLLSPEWLNKRETSRRVYQRIKAVFEYSIAKDKRENNPCEGLLKVLPKQKQNGNHFASLHYNKIPAFLSDLDQSNALLTTKLALRFLILNAARTNEVLLINWDEIGGNTWTIPSTRMKSERTHRVPLSAPALAVLDEARSLNDDGLIFPGRQDKPLSNMSMLKLTKGLRPGVTVHGFRSSFRDWCSEQTNYPREVVEHALAHIVENKTEAAYFRSDLFDKRRALMAEWSGWCCDG